MHFHPIEHSVDGVFVAQGGGGHAHEASAASAAVYDPLDDVFGSAEEAVPASSLDNRPDSASHPSDMHRLETEHSTAGYREGVTVAKEKTVQAGFDEGFSLGATIGLVAGQLLGALEGIEEAVRNQNDEAAEKAKKLLGEAREELGVARIFSPDFWAPDGNWSYEVKPEAGNEVLFQDVASAHPLIRKWSSIVDDEIRAWKIVRSVLDGEEDGAARIEAVADEPAMSSLAAPASSSKKALDW